jgi:hypothetical protein
VAFSTLKHPPAPYEQLHSTLQELSRDVIPGYPSLREFIQAEGLELPALPLPSAQVQQHITPQVCKGVPRNQKQDTYTTFGAVNHPVKLGLRTEAMTNHPFPGMMHI